MYPFCGENYSPIANTNIVLILLRFRCSIVPGLIHFILNLTIIYQIVFFYKRFKTCVLSHYAKYYRKYVIEPISNSIYIYLFEINYLISFLEPIRNEKVGLHYNRLFFVNCSSNKINMRIYVFLV